MHAWYDRLDNGGRLQSNKMYDIVASGRLRFFSFMHIHFQILSASQQGGARCFEQFVYYMCILRRVIFVAQFLIATLLTVKCNSKLVWAACLKNKFYWFTMHYGTILLRIQLFSEWFFNLNHPSSPWFLTSSLNISTPFFCR